jgi:hypothetical protein
MGPVVGLFTLGCAGLGGLGGSKAWGEVLKTLAPGSLNLAVEGS